MFGFLLRNVFHGRKIITASSSYMLFNNEPSISRLSNALRFFETSAHCQSFTASYLIKKLGFSQESALKLSKHVLFKTPEKPDSVISFLEEKDDKAVKVLQRSPFIISYDLNSYVTPNFNILLENGVPKSNIINAFYLYPNTFLTNSDYFKEIVNKVKERGFNPLEFKFLLAVAVVTKNSKSNWESKFDVYKKWGLSEKQIWEAFLKYPCVMEASQDKIAKTMEFLINTMGIEPSAIANQGSVIGRSLEKLIVPRGLFVQDLISNGLAIKFTLSSLFDISEQLFVKRFVYRFEDKVPELLKLYKQKVDVAVGGKYKTQRIHRTFPWLF
ncbi:Mitochodrial transcription termination factor-related protein [Corchorus olitorius]|uniref:Mitochodrial transcription termination factor-related protein n=1 Tax=Corchorus olitorius TaxID=93759 RepID=A0A1R3I3L0_9ROSI|nr:Mitochodrial transcription termination factor-related protein [Corchorus olitorius]